MSWKLHGMVFRISFGILFGPRNLPLDGLWRHMSYIILVNDGAIEGSVKEVLVSNMKFSCVCHAYWWMTHVHLDRWYVGSNYRGACLWYDSFCVEYNLPFINVNPREWIKVKIYRGVNS